MACRMRLWNPEWTNITTTHDIYKADVHSKKSPVYIEIMYNGTCSANATEIGAAADSAKDGTTTPFKLVIVSSSADDTDNAAKDVRAVRVIGISVPGNGATIAAATGFVDPDWANKQVYSIEEIKMNGTTDVYSTRFWINK